MILVKGNRRGGLSYIDYNAEQGRDPLFFHYEHYIFVSLYNEFQSLVDGYFKKSLFF